MKQRIQRITAWVMSISLIGIGLALSGTLLTFPATAAPPPKNEIILPLVKGFHNGGEVFYITTEASDQGQATIDGSNFVPSLAFAGATIPLYHVTNFTQPNVLSAVPDPVGPQNSNFAYSPLWQVNLVTWQAGFTPVPLMSVSEVFAAQAAGKVTIAPAGIVVNCPIVFTPTGGTLPSTLKIKIDFDNEDREDQD